MKPYIH